MARVKGKKPVEVQKFGGTEDLGKTLFNGHEHEVATSESMSETKLEFDQGHGNAAIIRCFTFGANPEAFNEHPPTTQELFNAHLKGIEIALWRDGLGILTDVQPRIKFSEDRMRYQIFVGAKPAKGQLLTQRPQTLTEIIRGESFGTE